MRRSSTSTQDNSALAENSAIAAEAIKNGFPVTKVPQKKPKPTEEETELLRKLGITEQEGETVVQAAIRQGKGDALKELFAARTNGSSAPQQTTSSESNGSSAPQQTTGKAQPTSAAKPAKREAAIHTKEYKEAVRETKQILKQEDTGRWRILQLADGLETKYGEETLKHFADDTGQCLGTLARHLSVYRAWYGADAAAYEARTGKEAAPPESFAVAQELQAHPDRFQLVKEWPDMPTREARKLGGKRKGKGKGKQKHDWLGNNAEGDFQHVYKLANEFISATTFVDSEIKPDLEELLREVTRTNRGLVPTFRKLADRATKVANLFEMVAGIAGEE